MGLLYCKAFLGLLAFDLLGLGRNFGRLYRTVRDWPVSGVLPPPDTADRVCQAVNYACAWYPKRALCLQRSAVTVCLLRSVGVAARMALGAQNLPLRAHAWVEVNERAINERRNVQSRYAVWDRC
jgi:hypothetical protein